MQPLIIAAIAFVGTHFLLSHPLRAPLVRGLGERGFSALYSLVALATFAWLVVQYRAAPARPPLWPVDDVLWAIVTVVMLVASILFMGSLIKNPALPNRNLATHSLASPGAAAKAPPEVPSQAKGVFAVTRHPMMWAFALWGFCHIAVMPTLANIILCAAIIILALCGASLQDRKKRQLQPQTWLLWEAKTSYWPFAAIAQGRARFGGFRPHDWAGGVVIWLAATWAHIPAAHIAAGIWRWL
ncbi:MAG TPA: NnrU family protein [Rhizomicrobium sp.]|nr:NnrU family protein [Rhizomicrobium sp.]